jgi:hypothetical protein
MSPRTFSEIVRPALADRKGKATFIGTPRGYNNFYDIYQQAEELPDWSRYLMAWDNTNILDSEEVEAARKEMTKAQFNQEFCCSWSAAIQGAYYAKEMEQARIGRVPHDPALRVTTTWDLGVSDSTVIWFLQAIGSEIRAINCLAFQGTGLPDIVRKLNDLPYNYDQHIFPNDVRVQELGTGKTRVEMLSELGVRATVSPKISLADGIEATRSIIPRMFFDQENCRDGIEALRQYRTEYDDKRQVFRSTPLHNWCSDYVDSLRYYAITKRTPIGDPRHSDWSYAINT